MKHYKDPVTNEIYAYEADGFQDEFIKPGLVAITDNEVNAMRQAASQAALSGITYADKRRAEYPSFINYLDGVVKGDQAQVQAYIDACLAVKAKYPKE